MERNILAENMMVSSKKLDGARVPVLRNHQTYKDNFTITKMVIDSCSFSVNKTYDKLRLSEFSK
jgi:hypothetical protein